MVIDGSEVADLLKNGTPDGVKVVYVDGDLSTNNFKGNVTLDCSFIVSGTINLAGNITINGLVYSTNTNKTASTVSMEGSAKVNGMLITQGSATVSGSLGAAYNAELAAWIKNFLSYFKVEETETKLTGQSLDEGPIAEANC